MHKHPWVQIPAGEIGVVISQIGAPLPIGAKSAFYDPSFGNFADAFLVLTANDVFGVPIGGDLGVTGAGDLSPAGFGSIPITCE